MSQPAPAAYQHNGKPVGYTAFYAIACDPQRSVAVEACAGAGKTWMLVSRIVRALLEGAAPHEILAITFTKKAAGEMRSRLYQRLVQFARTAPQELQSELVSMGISPESSSSLEMPLHNLYQSVLDAGRPVQVRTFHAWFAALLRNAPLSVLQALGLPVNYELLEDDTQAVAQLWRRFYAVVAAHPQARTDFTELVAEHGRHNTHKALNAGLAKRVEFALADAQGVLDRSVKRWNEQFPEFAGYSSPDDLLLSGGACCTLLAEAATALASGGNATQRKQGVALACALQTSQLNAALLALLTKAGTARKNMGPHPAVRDAQALTERIQQAVHQHSAWLYQQRMTRLTRLLVAEFSALKRDEGWVDMNDVEQAALTLLADPVASGWVQERLDARVKHLLIDEFQDTNPLQWQALSAWLGSYAGAGGGGNGAPSVFMVGDPKQSIYRFRRAEPQVFLAAQRFVAQGLDGDVLACDHTRRCAPPVLAAVNAVLGAAQAAGEYTGFRSHTTHSSDTGAVVCLPAIARDANDAEDVSDEEDAAQMHKPPGLGDGELVWRNSLATPRLLAEDSLRMLESRQAARWVAGQLAQGRQPKDLLVLARKRDRLAPMHDALRALHIPAWQPEKSALADAPEVQDLLALLDVLVSPTHDLSLARALRSPLFALDDAVLVKIAQQQRAVRQAMGSATSWFDLLSFQELAVHIAPALAATLMQWQAWVSQLPPHDALQAIYDDGDVLARFAAAAPVALRGSVLANLRALLGAALQINGARYATPYALVRALKAGDSGLKAPAQADVNAVRLLTVHGAKGLEAHSVLLLDADGPPPKAGAMSVLVDWPGEAAAPERFTFLASEKNPPACTMDALAVDLAARAREELNALYVAMTRAGGQLVLSSVAPPANRPPDGRSPWQRLLAATALTPGLSSHLPAPLADAYGKANADLHADQFALLCVPSIPKAQKSTAADAGQSLVNDYASTPFPQSTTDAASAALGRAMHRLLEWATPGTPFRAMQLRSVALEFGLGAVQVQQAQQMAQRILSGQGGWAWDPAQIDWQGNEVALAHQGEGGQTQLLRVDRLVRHTHTGVWWVLDYKSALQPQRQSDLLAQMHQYCAAVQSAQPGAPVKAAFLASDGTLVEVA